MIIDGKRAENLLHRWLSTNRTLDALFGGRRALLGLWRALLGLWLTLLDRAALLALALQWTPRLLGKLPFVAKSL